MQLSPKVAALSTTSCQLVPKTDHLPWGLVMCSVVVLHASILTKFPTVGVLDDCRGLIKLLNPHSHAHILHLEELPQKTNSIFQSTIEAGGFYKRTAYKINKITNP